MSVLKKALKAGITVKAIQIAQRELSKPENQAKISEAFRKLQANLRTRR